MTVVGKKIPNSLLVCLGLGGIALGLVVLTVLPHIWATILGHLIIGFAVAGIIVPAQTMIQQETPPALMGRVGSTVMSMFFASQIGGLLLSGVLGDAIGVRNVFALCALMLVLLIGIGRLWMEPKGAVAV